MLIVVQIVEELLAAAPSRASQTSESDACASGVSVMEQENACDTEWIRECDYL